MAIKNQRGHASPQSGFAHVLALLLLLAGLGVSVYLVQQQTNLFPKAAAPVLITCSACRADINRDGQVNITDFGRLVRCMGKSASESASGFSCEVSDINDNGQVTTDDFTCLREQYGKLCNLPTSIPVPTPSSSFSVGTNVTGIIHYGYKDQNPYCFASAGYAVGGASVPVSTLPGGGGTSLYVDPNSADLSALVVITVTAELQCSANIKPSFDAGLGNCRGGCGTGGVSDGCTCSGGNPKDSKACWWRWTCDAITPGSYTATFNTIFLDTASSSIDADLLEMQRMGMKIVRIFAANKNIDDNEAARRLGIFLDKASQYGISAIVSMIDFYNSGFSPQGLDPYYTGNYNGIGLLGHEFFESGYKTRYKDFVRTLVTANKGKSNIYAWEPGNELKFDSNPQIFIDFMKDITGYIKTLDSDHQVATGMMYAGHTALSPQDLYSQLPAVDIVSVHTYDGDRNGVLDLNWAKANNKSVAVEEFGFSGIGDRSASIRNELNYWKDRGATTVLHWGFIAKGLADNGNGDNRYGMDTIWHTDYDVLALLYQSFNNAYDPTVTPPPTTSTSCSSDKDCLTDYKCQIQATTLRECPVDTPNCNTVVGKCVSVPTGKPKPSSFPIESSY